MKLPVPLSRKLKSSAALDVSDLRSASFWLAQACMVAATVAGVYLASNEGFTRALEFYAVAEHKASYHMVRALRSELVANVEEVEAFTAAGKESLPRGDGDSPALQRFIWTSLNGSERTYELPVVVLNGVQSYYHRAEEHIRTAVDSRQWADQRQRALTQLAETNQQLRDKVLPALDEEMARRQAALKPYGLLQD